MTKTISSYQELKMTIPDFEGQVVLLSSYDEEWASENNAVPYGGGEFISVSGSGIDDGGHICVPINQNNFYWLRLTNEVNISDYGVKTFSWNPSNITIENDQSDKLNAALRRAAYTGFPLIAPPSSFNNSQRGIPVLKSIILTDVKEIQGDLLLFAHNIRGNYTNDPGLTIATGVDQPFVLFNMNGNFAENGGYVFSTVKGPRTYETIRVINLGDLSTRLNGQLHFFASTIFKRCFSANFNGHGVRWGIIQDSIIEHQSQSKCGNINQFALYAYNYPVATGSRSDYCNNVTFKSIITEYSQDRSLFIAGPAVRYERIHEEGTITSGETPEKWGTYSIDAYAKNYGSKIANTALALNNGSGAQLNVIDLNELSIASQNIVINMAYTELGLVHANRSTSSASTQPTNVIIATGWAGDGGMINTIHADHVFIGDTVSKISAVGAALLELRGPSTVVDSARVRVLNLYSGTVNNFSGPSSGYANLGGANFPARLVNSTILDCPIYIDTSSSSDTIIENCHIATSITRGRYDGTTISATGSRPVSFRGCTFPNTLNLPSAEALIEFSNCAFSHLMINKTTDTYYQIHKGSRINKLTMSTGVQGLWAFDDSTVLKSFVGDWIWPDNAYGNYNLRVCNLMDGLTRKYTDSGWVGDVN